ncbi:thioredoxin fold domain-containing protein [Geomonas silvestris]|uniref:thioredoxin fold domain-containing protein n=1 Tax=Geomonas silvestris TaxID=2740184 RepID=UPI0016130C27|nr:thioredoxin fold domain-containing protein [Geomonas silvestris]
MRRALTCTVALYLALGVLCTLSSAAETSRYGELPLDQAIRIGSGREVVVEISDPDCRFSRRMVRYWDQRQDVSRFIFMVALSNHPEAAGKVRYILCARDRVAAYREVYSGGLDFGEKSSERQCDDQGLARVHREVAAKVGAVGTPTYLIKGVKVDGAKVGEIERLLGGAKIPFSAGDPDW